MSIFRSGEIFSNRAGGGGGGLLRERERAAGWERLDGLAAGWDAFERPLRPATGLGFLLEEGFDRVIGMAKSLYCLLVELINCDSLFCAVQVLFKFMKADPLIYANLH